MKKLIALFAFAFVALGAMAQQQSPVKWTAKAVKEKANTYKVIFTATFANPWHIYSQTTPDGGPVPTSFDFAKNPLVTLDGKTVEKGKLHVTHDPNFGVDVKYYTNQVDFIQTVKTRGNVKTTLSGAINFMVCDDHQCLPPSDHKFSVKLQ